jgi:citrate lyase subunit beta / citryl-CoA lyase
VSWITSALYVPGNKPAWFLKALDGDADQVILDLQDSVPLNEKDRALSEVVSFLKSASKDQISKLQVRVCGNEKELQALQDASASISIRLPKVENRASLEPWSVFRYLVPLIESARGFLSIDEVAGHPKVEMLAMGELDLASELLTSHPDVFSHLRMQLILASAANGLRPPMMSAWTNLSDPEGFAQDCDRGRDLGFIGRTAIHPSQISVIQEAFQVTSSELERKREIQQLIGQSGGAALSSAGDMVDSANLRTRVGREL